MAEKGNNAEGIPCGNACSNARIVACTVMHLRNPQERALEQATQTPVSYCLLFDLNQSTGGMLSYFRIGRPAGFLGAANPAANAALQGRLGKGRWSL